MTSIDLPDPGDGSARRSKPRAPRQDKAADRGKLRIGDDWNAIRIIALSQSNPLKAIAEFVENSIDAHAKTITITRPAREGAPAMTDFLRSAVPPPRIDTFALQTAESLATPGFAAGPSNH